MARTRPLRYIVTGPGIDDPPSYAEPGPALSRTVTRAAKASLAKQEATYYARDSITGDIIGHSESDSNGVVWTTRRQI